MTRLVSGVKPYQAMKPSGVEWLGSVPEHWRVRRTKTLLRERVEKGFTDEPLLAATQSKGVVRKDQYANRTVIALKDLHLLKLVRVGDFVISLRSFQGGIEYAREQGIISPAYTVLLPSHSEMRGFLARLFKSKPYIDNLSLYVTGIRQGQNIDYAKLARSMLPVPPVDDQMAIVRYLDHVDRRISRYIRAKQRLIVLLEEQKQAIINRAVTRGLEPDVRLKPSGVEWLGHVPEHWEVIRLKGHVSNVTDQTRELDSNAAYVALEHVQSWTGRVRQATTNGAPESQLKRFQSGDVLFGKLRPYLAKVARARTDGVCVGEFLVLRPRGSELLPSYIENILRSRPVINAVNASTFGAKMPRADWRFVGGMKIPLPSRTEQSAIVRYLDEATTEIDANTVRTRREIELLGEYRTRLIADVVTGKLDVREAAAALPEVHSTDLEDIIKIDEVATDALAPELEEVST